MPELTIENEVKAIWDKTVSIIKSGNIVKNITNKKRLTNFPEMSLNKACHVRPHARNSNDTYKLPIADKLTGDTCYTKHCFGLIINI